MHTARRLSCTALPARRARGEERGMRPIKRWFRAIVVIISAALIGVLTLTTGTASADPVNQPAYVVNCGGTIYNVVSPARAITGADVNSTSQLIIVVGKVPKSLTTVCTATNVATGETFTGLFLITPAG
jgi:hypothetical protein